MSLSAPDPFIACSKCFIDERLRLDAERLGEDDPSPCPNCEANDGRKLSPGRLATLAQDFLCLMARSPALQSSSG